MAARRASVAPYMTPLQEDAPDEEMPLQESASVLQQMEAALNLEHLGASSREKSFPVCAKERRHVKHSSVESIARAAFGAYISRSAYISLWCVYIYPWGAVVRFGAPTRARGCEPARAPPVPAAHQACRSEKTYRAA